MDADNRTPNGTEGMSYGTVLKEVAVSLKSLIQSEVQLLKAEAKETSRELGRHAAQASVFGALLALSTLPFLAFLVIGLGRILDGNYWLSSLLVAIVCAAVGGMMTYRVYKRIKAMDLSLPHTRGTFEASRDTATGKLTEVQHEAQQHLSEIKDSTQRRAS